MTPILLGLGLSSVATDVAPEPEPIEVTAAAEVAMAPAPQAGLSPVHTVQLGDMASPFRRAQLSRGWRPAGAIAVGTVGSLFGYILAIPTAGVGVLVTVPLGAALGVHFFTDAGLGFEFLGGFIGLIAFIPVGLITALGLGFSQVEALTSGKQARIEGAAIGIVAVLSVEALMLPVIGAYVAASLHHSDKQHRGASATLLPGLVSERTSGAVFSVRW